MPSIKFCIAQMFNVFFYHQYQIRHERFIIYRVQKYICWDGHMSSIFIVDRHWHIGSLAHNLPPVPIDNIIQNICFGFPSHVSISFVWCPHNPSLPPSLSPQFCSTTVKDVDVLGNERCSGGFYWRVERGIKIDEGLFEFQAQIKNLRPYSPFSLFIFPSLLPKWCQWKPSYRAIYRISPSHQNHMVQSQGTMITSREESAWIETVNIYELGKLSHDVPPA